MKRTFSSMRVGGDMVKAKTVLRGEEVEGVEKGSNDYRQLYWLFWKQIGDQPDLASCQGAHPEHAHFFWDGKAWCAEFTALVPEKK